MIELKKRDIKDHCVYHIKRPGMGLDMGYIGVTMNLPRRHKNHSDQLGKSSKYMRIASIIFSDIVMEVIIEGNKKTCYELEKQLRPKKRMGWNIAPGGGGRYKDVKYPEKFKWRNINTGEVVIKTCVDMSEHVWGKAGRINGEFTKLMKGGQKSQARNTVKGWVIDLKFRASIINKYREVKDDLRTRG